jgi:hypothetical protein
MPSRQEIVRTYLEAQKSREPAQIKAVGDQIAEEATLVSMRGNLAGRDAILERLANPGQAAMLLDRISWKAPEEDGDQITVHAELPAGLPIPIQGFSARFDFGEGDRIQKIEFILQR